MATTAYNDLGALQRIESGSETAKANYVDLGAVQRQESGAAFNPAWNVSANTVIQPGTLQV